MRFDSDAASRLYADRTVDESWRAWCAETLSPAGKVVADIGCGGGIYAFGFAALGAREVHGVDASAPYVLEASRSAGVDGAVRFHHGTASATGLPSHRADIVFERALIHHLTEEEKVANLAEVRRITKPGGLLCVQDRTYEDAMEVRPEFWIRTTLFELFPQLEAFERGRRPSAAAYEGLLREGGFSRIQTLAHPEIRRRYATFGTLRQEIMARKGKSILFQLSDAELRHYCDVLQSKSEAHPLIECDPWTVWIAQSGPLP